MLQLGYDKEGVTYTLYLEAHTGLDRDGWIAALRSGCVGAKGKKSAGVRLGVYGVAPTGAWRCCVQKVEQQRVRSCSRIPPWVSMDHLPNAPLRH
jgi:hypothetical protein